MTPRIGLVLVTAWLPLSALAQEPRAWSYTMQEVYERAESLKTLVEKKNVPSETPALIEASIKAGEFKGYIAAILDNSSKENKSLRECAKVLPLNDIAYRAAVLTTRDPLDRSHNAAVSIHLSLRLICDYAISQKPTR
jgi:hypothetical protein